METPARAREFGVHDAVAVLEGGTWQDDAMLKAVSLVLVAIAAVIAVGRWFVCRSPEKGSASGVHGGKRTGINLP